MPNSRQIREARAREALRPEVLEMIKEGRTFREMAKAIGRSTGLVQRVVRECRELTAEQAAELQGEIWRQQVDEVGEVKALVLGTIFGYAGEDGEVVEPEKLSPRDKAVLASVFLSLIAEERKLFGMELDGGQFGSKGKSAEELPDVDSMSDEEVARKLRELGG